MYYGHPNQRYFDVLLAFKETLSEFTISHYYLFLNRTTKEFAHDLNTFTNLKSVKLYTAFREFLELELLLKECTRLKRLELADVWTAKL